MTTMADFPAGLLEKVMTRVHIAEQTGCWEYTGSKQSKLGYGSVYIKQRNGKNWQMVAHRLMWILRHGRVPDRTEFVCHKCDNPPCCNPDHMFLGSLADNNKDMASKGRYNHQKKTHCPHGHEFTLENIYRAPSRPNKRACRSCMRDRNRLEWHINPQRRERQNALRRQRRSITQPEKQP